MLHAGHEQRDSSLHGLLPPTATHTVITSMLNRKCCNQTSFHVHSENFPLHTYIHAHAPTRHTKWRAGDGNGARSVSVSKH